MAVGVVTAFPGTPLGTIRESSSSFGSPRSKEYPASLPACKEDEQTASIGSHARAADIPFQQGGPLQGEHRADGALQLPPDRQTGHAVKGQRAGGTFQADSERQAGHVFEGQRAEDAFQAECERQAGHEAEWKESEAAGSLQSPCDNVSEVAESLLLSHDLQRHGSSSAASVISEVLPEADGAVQAISSAGASGELFSSTTILLLHTQTVYVRAWSCKHQAHSC